MEELRIYAPLILLVTYGRTARRYQSYYGVGRMYFPPDTAEFG